MLSEKRSADLSRLKEELASEPCLVLLEELRRADPFYQQFQSWAEVVTFMRTGTSCDPAKDWVLGPIFRCHEEDQDPRWRTILLVIFWPGLESLHRKKCLPDSEADVLWSNVIWAFLQTVCKLKATRRADRLVQKVINDTYHRLHEIYIKEWAWPSYLSSLDKLPAADLARTVPTVDPAFAKFEQRHDQDAEIRRLNARHEAGSLSEQDLWLLIGTRIYGKSLRTCAECLGLSYEAAKKRRQRAEAATGFGENL